MIVYLLWDESEGDNHFIIGAYTGFIEARVSVSNYAACKGVRIDSQGYLNGRDEKYYNLGEYIHLAIRKMTVSTEPTILF
jgi:hypothetical protein